jgi:hypothetical protein
MLTLPWHLIPPLIYSEVLCTPILWFIFLIGLMRLITVRYFCHFFFLNFRFICFVYSNLSTWTIFQLTGDCHHYQWQGWKFRRMLSTYGFSSEDSFTCHTCCDAGPLFMQFHLKDVPTIHSETDWLFVLYPTSNFSAIWRLTPLPVTGLQI